MILFRQYSYIALLIFICTACSSAGSRVAGETASAQPITVPATAAAPVTVAEPTATQASPVAPTVVAQPATEQASVLPLATIVQMHNIVLEIGEAARNRCSAVIFAASLANQGNVTLAGTLTFDAAGNSAYAPTPTDHLSLIEATGLESKFFVNKFDGLNRESMQGFLQDDHYIDCNWRSEYSDLHVASARVGDQQEVQIQGWVSDAGRRLEAALTRQTTDKFDIGTAAKHESYSVLSGTTRLDALEITVKQETEYTLIDTVEQHRETFTLAWGQDNNQYELREGYWQAVFRDGVRIEDDFWQAGGALLRNGDLYGELQLQTPPGLVQLVLSMPNGIVVLREWQ